MAQKYLFIDGGFLRSFVRSQSRKAFDAPSVFDIDWNIIGRHFDRILYYDALPEKKENQTDDEFQEELQDVENLFDRIASTSKFSVRPALTRRGRKREQKGVDILLSIECLLHAVRNNVDEATIITSDLDFFPLFEALLQTRTKSTIWYEAGKTSKELIMSADSQLGITAREVHLWSTTSRIYSDLIQISPHDLSDASNCSKTEFMGEEILVK